MKRKKERKVGGGGRRGKIGTFLVVQWLRLHASNPWGTGSLDQETKIHTWHMPRGQKKKKKNNKSAKVVSVFYDCITSHSNNLVA